MLCISNVLIHSLKIDQTVVKEARQNTNCLSVSVLFEKHVIKLFSKSRFCPMCVSAHIADDGLNHTCLSQQNKIPWRASAQVQLRLAKEGKKSISPGKKSQNVS